MYTRKSRKVMFLEEMDRIIPRSDLAQALRPIVRIRPVRDTIPWEWGACCASASCSTGSICGTGTGTGTGTCQSGDGEVAVIADLTGEERLDDANQVKQIFM